MVVNGAVVCCFVHCLIVSGFFLVKDQRMAPKITEEMRQALQQQPDRPLKIEDDQTQKTYVLLSQENFRHWVDAELRRELQVGFDQADAGDVAEWDVEQILKEAHARHAAKTE
ncbi:hypothetical protein [uncultured Gimesia sp.]|jgi:signal transduction protein with GAF and PtsI domain|uniref:hypothetical protein n=1 Tax=uncultured Gimesia sp. TaxID=1678688 RepID=UPI002604AADE|nr:hypothetical protein [uncultured Gimesia sp.]